LLRRLGTILKWVILVPILIAIVLLAVANGAIVTVRFNPFNPDDPFLRADLPLYQLGFLIFVVGALVGGLVAWTSELKRRRLRARRDDAPAYRGASRGSPPPSAGYLPRPGSG
jgi:uncharacterized integral membrane protein